MPNAAIKFFFLFLISPFILLAGNGDSLELPKKTGKTSFFTENQFGFADSAHFIDESLSGFQNYLGRNHLGNSGLAFNDLLLRDLNGKAEFNYFKNNYLPYFYTPKSLKFYDTHSPYTDLLYVIGSKKEQDFKMTFSYNVKKNWNITADFFRIRSEGFYLRQNTNNNFIAFSTNYKSKNNRYYLLGGVMYNFVQNFENGGIADDSVFENEVGADKRLIDVNLTFAKRSLLNRSVFLKQYINLGLKSADTSANAAVIPNSQLVLTTLADDYLMKYEDENPLSGFYSNIYNDSSRTFDSAYTFKLENELTWKRIDNGKHRGFKDLLGLSLSVKDQFVNVKQREIDSTFNNVIAGFSLYNTYSTRRLWLVLSGKYALTGYNQDDYGVEGSIRKGIKDSLTDLSIHFSSKLQEPDFIYQHYSSNHFKWNNDFEKIQTNRVGLNFSMKKYRLSVGADIIEYSKPVYFDNYGIAKQYAGSVAVASAHLKKNFTFFNWHLDNTIHYQNVPDSVVIRLPELVLEHSLYYENDLFKGAMHMQIGASVFFVSEYYANAYMPATGQFYLQSDKKYGNYPFVDFFINARVKAVRVFFKIDHLNSGWSGTNYMMTPHYPTNDRAFKLGISWRFYD
ncbi:MAG TPA: putative porin [Bacteroidia bacterium]|jgi:hypothetical protein